MFEVPRQTAELPEMLPGVEGIAVMETGKVIAVLEPQTLLAITVMLPPELPALAKMALELEVPLQPLGNVQLYVLAPATA